MHLGFHKVASTTVYQALVRLTDLTYLPQFADLSNTATCAVTDQAYLLVRYSIAYLVWYETDAG